MKDMGNMCLYCRQDTSFGSGRFVNRIPASNETESGWMCPDCQVVDADIPEDREEIIGDLMDRLDEWDDEDRPDRDTFRAELEGMDLEELQQEWYDEFYA